MYISEAQRRLDECKTIEEEQAVLKGFTDDHILWEDACNKEVLQNFSEDLWKLFDRGQKEGL